MTLVDLNGCLPTWGSIADAAADWADDTWNGVCETVDNACDYAYETAVDACDYVQGEWEDFCDTATETYHYVKDSVTEWATETAETAETLYKLYTDPEFHYNRNQYNEVVTDISEVCDLDTKDYKGKNGWKLLGPDKTSYHVITDSEQGEDAKYNKKYVKVNEDGTSSSEVIICFPEDGREPYIVTDPVNAGTFNYCDVSESEIGHAIFDVFPYWRYGNQKEDSGEEYILYRMIGTELKGIDVSGVSSLWYHGVKLIECLS